MYKIAVFHGPNLNLLGIREPDIYGCIRLDEINEMLKDQAKKSNIEITCGQSNSEHELINWIHASHDVDYIIINPAAFTHTSIAIRDALACVNVPFIEVHLSNIHAREAFRSVSYFSQLATGVICGLGHKGYLCALNFAITQLQNKD